jgi:hypothetical protein
MKIDVKYVPSTKKGTYHRRCFLYHEHDYIVGVSFQGLTEEEVKELYG